MNTTKKISEKPVEVNVYPNPKLFVMFAVREMIDQNREKRVDTAARIYEALEEMMNRSDLEVSPDERSIVL